MLYDGQASPISIDLVDQTSSDVLALIHKECFPTYWNSKEFTNFFDTENTHALLATADEQMGMIVYRASFEQADIITLAVRKAYRKRGIARKLVERAMAHLKELGANEIFLDVEDGNEAALQLYKSFGFSYIRHRKLYYRQKDGTYTDALVMQKKL